ncbi:hypothetical protein HPB50_004216 [Hyalomma asiaticum]|uniref:Uncharacterized protein n=1 Tax=Hyalomma asiaticum TaxID=266040 RepID=A0ACB7STA3_HYAAI|nr:hypothetical protein HPB50_004216 [Hyalomma asiaticum]
MSFCDPECLTAAEAEVALAAAAFFLDDPRRGPVCRTRRMSCLCRPVVAGGAGGSGEDWPDELGEPGRSRLMALSMDGTRRVPTRDALYRSPFPLNAARRPTVGPSAAAGRKKDRGERGKSGQQDFARQACGRACADPQPHAGNRRRLYPSLYA